MNELSKLLELSPIIAAVRDDKDFESAINSPVSVIFALNANIMNLNDIILKAKKCDKNIFVHIDIADGIGKDAKGLSYISDCGVKGIISTRSGLIKVAKEIGLTTVQRFFMVDSRSLDTAYENIKQAKPDMVEIMPGIIPGVISEMKKKVSVPLIAGGLIETKDDVINAIRAGASGISTGKGQLWFE